MYQPTFSTMQFQQAPVTSELFPLTQLSFFFFTYLILILLKDLIYRWRTDVSYNTVHNLYDLLSKSNTFMIYFHSFEI